MPDIFEFMPLSELQWHQPITTNEGDTMTTTTFTVTVKTDDLPVDDAYEMRHRIADGLGIDAYSVEVGEYDPELERVQGAFEVLGEDGAKKAKQHQVAKKMFTRMLANGEVTDAGLAEAIDAGFVEQDIHNGTRVKAKIRFTAEATVLVRDVLVSDRRIADALVERWVRGAVESEAEGALRQVWSYFGADTSAIPSSDPLAQFITCGSTYLDSNAGRILSIDSFEPVES